MIPIQDLFNKIRWDKEFGKGYFEIGYEDHWEEKIIRVAFKKVVFEEGNQFSFQIKLGGEMVTIPFHRVKEVYRDGGLIWQRSH
jgi:uncharacterized protein (UPF0248 family)